MFDAALRPWVDPPLDMLGGGETIAVFCAVCLWPAGFALIAYAFSALCFASAVARALAGWRNLAG